MKGKTMTWLKEFYPANEETGEFDPIVAAYREKEAPK
jgi:hypothetical protein